MAANVKKFGDFDPVAEPAVVRIRILPMRYLRVRGKVYAPEQGVETGADGKAKGVWKYHNAEVWVPERIANRVTVSGERSDEGQVNPIAQMVATRTREEALAEAEADAADAAPAKDAASPTPKPEGGDKPTRRAMTGGTAAGAV